METANLDRLATVIDRLPASRAGFAQDLIDQARRRGLSEKQWDWVGRLIAMAEQPAPQPEQMGDMSGLIALFEAAKKNLKHPKVRLATEGGTPVVFSLAGGRSKYEGSVMVTDGGPYGSNRYYGRVSPQGELVGGAAITPEVKRVIRAMSEAPAATAARHGQLTGCCCFCNRALTDERSTAVGYGPVCAQNFELPWGE